MPVQQVPASSPAVSIASMDSKLPGVWIMFASVLAKLSLAGSKMEARAAGGPAGWLITTAGSGGGALSR